VSEARQERQASAELALRLGQLLQKMHALDDAKRCLALSAQHCIDIGDAAGQALALNQLAHLACEEQRYSDAERLAHKAGTLVKRTSPTYAMSLSVLASTRLLTRALLPAEMLYQQALKLWSALRAAHECAHSLHNLGYLMALQGRPLQAIVYYEDALQHLPDDADVAYRAVIQAQLALNHVAVGNYQQGLALLLAAEPVVHHVADDQLLAHVWLGQAQCYRALRQHAWAEVAFARSAHFSAKAGDWRVYRVAHEGLNAVAGRQ
jgi:tetratricopeptide (TPR) repeat protein